MARRPPVHFGDRFDRLVVIGPGEHKTNERGHTIYHAKVACICGTQFSVAITSLKSGNTRSCGCINDERRRISPLNLRHGMVGTPTYKTWQSMKARCNNSRDTVFKNYGGKGISVCERWLKFENFLADMGERPSGMSLDRIDNSGNYEPGNCRWATDLTQAFNQSHTTRVTFGGNVVSFSEAARKIGRTTSTLREWGAKYGYSPQQIVDHYRKLRGP